MDCEDQALGHGIFTDASLSYFDGVFGLHKNCMGHPILQMKFCSQQTRYERLIQEM